MFRTVDIGESSIGRARIVRESAACQGPRSADCECIMILVVRFYTQSSCQKASRNRRHRHVRPGQRSDYGQRSRRHELEEAFKASAPEVWGKGKRGGRGGDQSTRRAAMSAVGTVYSRLCMPVPRRCFPSALGLTACGCGALCPPAPHPHIRAQRLRDSAALLGQCGRGGPRDARRR